MMHYFLLKGESCNQAVDILFYKMSFLYNHILDTCVELVLELQHE